MRNFEYHIPTDICFGRGQIKRLGEKIGTIGKKVLWVYGGGSIKASGLYRQVQEELERAGVEFLELAGVDPNPRVQTVRAGVELCRKEGVEVVLAVGGGSVIDCAKMIAAGTCYDGDVWDLVVDADKIRKALPVVCVLTLAATGSEMDGYAVISDLTKNEKRSTGNNVTKPVLSIMDPQYTFSVSPRQTASGIADIMSHTFENYFNRVDGAYLQARLAEGVLKTCITYGPVALSQPDDYVARANLMWASSLAINGLLSYGAEVAWSVHPMEHELTAFYDITHGIGLAILTPCWMEYVLRDEAALPRFVEYGVNVWGIDAALPPMEIAKTAIRKTRAFLESIGMPDSLSDVGIDAAHFDEMASKAAAEGLDQGFVPLDAVDVRRIFEMAL